MSILYYEYPSSLSPCDDLKKFHSIQFLDGALHDNFSVVMKRAYCKTSVRGATIMRELAFLMNSIVDGGEMEGRDGARTDHSLVNGMLLLTLEEAACFLPRDGFQIILDKLFRMNICYSSRDVVSETSVVETSRKHLSTDGAYTSADIT